MNIAWDFHTHKYMLCFNPVGLLVRMVNRIWYNRLKQKTSIKKHFVCSRSISFRKFFFLFIFHHWSHLFGAHFINKLIYTAYAHTYTHLLFAPNSFAWLFFKIRSFSKPMRSCLFDICVCICICFCIFVVVWFDYIHFVGFFFLRLCTFIYFSHARPVCLLSLFQFHFNIAADKKLNIIIRFMQVVFCLCVCVVSGNRAE